MQSCSYLAIMVKMIHHSYLTVTIVTAYSVSDSYGACRGYCGSICLLYSTIKNMINTHYHIKDLNLPKNYTLTDNLRRQVLILLAPTYKSVGMLRLRVGVACGQTYCNIRGCNCTDLLLKTIKNIFEFNIDLLLQLKALIVNL